MAVGVRVPEGCEPLGTPAALLRHVPTTATVPARPVLFMLLACVSTGAPCTRTTLIMEETGSVNVAVVGIVDTIVDDSELCELALTSAGAAGAVGVAVAVTVAFGQVDAAGLAGCVVGAGGPEVDAEVAFEDVQAFWWRHCECALGDEELLLVDCTLPVHAHELFTDRTGMAEMATLVPTPAVIHAGVGAAAKVNACT